jgi:hypothetical protein
MPPPEKKHTFLAYFLELVFEDRYFRSGKFAYENVKYAGIRVYLLTHPLPSPRYRYT